MNNTRLCVIDGLCQFGGESVDIILKVVSFEHLLSEPTADFFRLLEEFPLPSLKTIAGELEYIIVWHSNSRGGIYTRFLCHNCAFNIPRNQFL